MEYLALYFVNKLPAELVTITRQAFKQAKKVARQHLNFKHYLNIIVAANPENTIVEQGASGTTYSEDLIVIYLDPNSTKLTQNIIYTTMCHELSHAQRWHLRPEWDNRLLGALILEGLAVAFEEEIAIAQREFFLRTIQGRSQASSKRILDIFHNELLVPDFSWEKKRRSYFVIGDQKLGLPRWAGYQAGYYLVKQHMARTGKKASELIGEPADNFFQ
jgi:uncharacterized protein YjaZ